MIDWRVSTTELAVKVNHFATQEEEALARYQPQDLSGTRV